MDTMIHPTAIVPGNCKIGKGTKVWHFVQIREEADVGENCSIGKSSYIGKGVKIGNNVRI